MKLKLKRWVKTPQYKSPIAEFYYLDKYGKCGIVNELQLDWLESQRPVPITEKYMLRELGKEPEARKDIYSYLKKTLHEDAVKFAPLQTGIGKINDEMIARAKDVPIDTLLDIGCNNIECLWHDDKSPSLSYHKKGNFVKCFACDEYADSIKVYQKINNCDFKTAVIEMQ
jgi:hypothetical protein